jgi:hypothetical protein
VTWLAVLIFVVTFIVWRFRSRPRVNKPENDNNYQAWSNYSADEGPHSDDGSEV